MKFTKVTTLIITLVILASFLQLSMALTEAKMTVSSSGCQSMCGGRCSKTDVNARCMKYCTICCQKCNCVPSGTYGNKHECPCYRDMVNTKGKPKCP